MNPPIDAPTRCTSPSPRPSMSPATSLAMSLIEYGGCLRRTHMSARRGGGRFRRWVDSPTSRLANRATNRPRWARPSHSSSGHAIICVARPMTSTTGGAPASPNVSYASSMSLAATRPSVRTATSSMAAVSHATNPRSLLDEVGLEDVEGIGHVGPAKADADMVRLVVDRAGKEQDTGLGELFAEPV